MKQRVILHCDANNFYASCECAQNSNLFDKPVAVTGNPQKRTGIILAKNNLAKQYGISTGDVIWQAKQKCPELICVSPHFDLYNKYSRKLKEIYMQYTDQVESFSIDECWLDVTDTQKFFGTGEEIANKIREQVKKELNITISVGVSFCKLFAKLGSDMKKPDAVTVISEANFTNKIYPLPINSIMGIGRRLEKALSKMNIETLGDFVKIPDSILSKKFGINGTRLKQKLLGNDFDIVKKFNEYDEVKSIGNGTTTIMDIKNIDDMKSVVMFLCDEIATRLRNKKMLSFCISASLRSSDLVWSGKSKTLNFPTNTEKDIFKTAMELIKCIWDLTSPIRSVRICCSSIVDEANNFQINLFENPTKKSNLNNAIDKVRKKYGYQAISPLVSINPKLINQDALRLDKYDDEI